MTERQRGRQGRKREREGGRGEGGNHTYMFILCVTTVRLCVILSLLYFPSVIPFYMIMGITHSDLGSPGRPQTSTQVPSCGHLQQLT